MKYRNVGKSGLKVSEIALGSWMTDLGGNAEVETAKQTIRLAYDNASTSFFPCSTEAVKNLVSLESESF